MAKNKPQKRNTLTVILTVLMITMIAATGVLMYLCITLPTTSPNFPEQSPVLEYTELTEPTPTETDPPETTWPEPEHVVATATICSMGDLLMHEPVFSNEGQYNSAVQQPDGSYDFESTFRYLSEYITELDYAAINLETTLASNTNGFPYKGYPLFNCPDEIIDGVKGAGFDMILTANNHSYDTTLVGYKRTIQVIREKGLQNLGTYESADDTKWTIVEVNGIKIGLLCYTYATGVAEEGRPNLNYNAAIAEPNLCNYFYSGNMPAFYSEVEKYLGQMKQAGAEATIMYIHWGQEYILTPNAEQQTIAQELCNLGIDVIVGGHPHVVQPIELLESTIDPEHKTVCLYSMGNAVSNQRKGLLKSIQTAHTEDGLLFSVTFEKYSDGTVYLAGVDVIPTWVNMHTNSSGRKEYNILPLDESRREEWQSLFDITESTYHAAEDSHARTMDIVGDGLQLVQNHLNHEKENREQYYQELVAAS